ncbi:PadR family transcriptional regulator [Marinoscillum sp.]|uniref:PadR family transcriptional regulator n=1 Tax=Marinoscillum sp. TaxID=2024838 RepID=UPI003BA90C92
MKTIGNLEETVLLLIMVIEEEAYGFTVSQAYEQHTGNKISISAIHTVLSRLESKGYIDSDMKGATKERGGRRKRIFTPTAAGKEIIAEIKASRQQLWSQIPGLS